MAPPRIAPTQEQLDRICDALRKHAFRETAIACAGVAPYIVRNWMRKGNADLREGVDSLEAKFVIDMDEAERVAEAELISGIKDRGFQPFVKSSGDKGDVFEPPDWKALAWIAERRGAKRWGIKKHLTVAIDRDREKLLDVAEKTLDPESYAKLLDAILAAEDSGGDSENSTGEATGEE